MSVTFVKSPWFGAGIGIAVGLLALTIAVVFPDPLGREAEKSLLETTPPAVEPGAYTKAYVATAIDRFDNDGSADTLAHYGSTTSVDGEWYLFILDEDGIVIVHPTVPENVGVSITSRLGTDIDGYEFGKEFLTATEDGKWVNYRYLNPARNNQQETKHTWIVRHDGLYFASGWYERSENPETDPSIDPNEYTQDFVQKAITRYNVQGRLDTLEYYNTTSSVDGAWFMVIMAEDGEILAVATLPDNVGRNITGTLGTDINGYNFGEDIVNVPDEGAWIEYTFLNPARNNQQEVKHAWVERHDGLLFLSGWYEARTIVDYLLPPGQYYPLIP